MLVGLKLWAVGETGALSVAASLADSAMDLMVSLGGLAAITYAARPADDDHTYGHTSAEDLAAIAAEMGLDALRPEWLGASIVVEGIEDFTHIPPSSRLQNGEGGTCLVVDMANRPCHWPGKEVEKDHPGLGKRFKQAAAGRRGVTAWVEYPGPLRVGDELRLHVPDQRAWAHHEHCLTGKLT